MTKLVALTLVLTIGLALTLTLTVAPVHAQTTTCRPDYSGGFTCTTPLPGDGVGGFLDAFDRARAQRQQQQMMEQQIEIQRQKLQQLEIQRQQVQRQQAEMERQQAELQQAERQRLEREAERYTVPPQARPQAPQARPYYYGPDNEGRMWECDAVACRAISAAEYRARRTP